MIEAMERLDKYPFFKKESRVLIPCVVGPNNCVAVFDADQVLPFLNTYFVRYPYEKGRVWDYKDETGCSVATYIQGWDTVACSPVILQKYFMP